METVKETNSVRLNPYSTGNTLIHEIYACGRDRISLNPYSTGNTLIEMVENVAVPEGAVSLNPYSTGNTLIEIRVPHNDNKQ